RLVSLEEGEVTFRSKGYADERRPKTMTLPADEFLRRFLMHVLPRGFVKWRPYGPLAKRYREAKRGAPRRGVPGGGGAAAGRGAGGGGGGGRPCGRAAALPGGRRGGLAGRGTGAPAVRRGGVPAAVGPR